MNINMKLPKKFIKSALVPCLVSLYLFPATQGFGQEHPGNKGPDAKSDSKWSTFIRGGYVHQFDTDIDNSKGSFASDRLFIQPGITYAPDHTCSFSLAIGYGYDGYDFQGETVLVLQDLGIISILFALVRQSFPIKDQAGHFL